MNRIGAFVFVLLVGIADTLVGIGGISVPTTVLLGSRNPRTPPDHTDTIAAAAAGVMQPLSGYAHILRLEIPDAVAGAIRSNVRAGRIA